MYNISKENIELLKHLVLGEIDRLKGKRDAEFKIYTALGFRNLDDKYYKQKLTELTNLLNELNPVSK